METKPKPSGFSAICTQARLQKVLFLLKTKLKPKKINGTKIPNQSQFVPNLMYHGTWYDKTKTKPKPMYLFL